MFLLAAGAGVLELGFPIRVGFSKPEFRVFYNSPRGKLGFFRVFSKPQNTPLDQEKKAHLYNRFTVLSNISID